MPTLREAVEWIAGNDTVEIGDEFSGYPLTVYLVADLFARKPAEIAWAVKAEREDKGWRLGRKAVAK